MVEHGGEVGCPLHLFDFDGDAEVLFPHRLEGFGEGFGAVLVGGEELDLGDLAVEVGLEAADDPVCDVRQGEGDLDDLEAGVVGRGGGGTLWFGL